MPGVKKAAVRHEIAKKFKIQNQEDRIAVFGLKTIFGGGRSSGFVSVYDDMDARHKYDTKINKFRVSQTPFECEVPGITEHSVIVYGAFPFFSLQNFKLYTLIGWNRC